MVCSVDNLYFTSLVVGPNLFDFVSSPHVLSLFFNKEKFWPDPFLLQESTIQSFKRRETWVAEKVRATLWERYTCFLTFNFSCWSVAMLTEFRDDFLFCQLILLCESDSSVLGLLGLSGFLWTIFCTPSFWWWIFFGSSSPVDVGLLSWTT
jgi:hypothetical protein